MIFFKALLLIISLVALSCIVGHFAMHFFKIREELLLSNILWSWILGTIFIWGLFQLVAVPCIFLRTRLSRLILLWGLLITAVFFFLILFYFKNHSKEKIKRTVSFSYSKWDKIFLFFLCLAALALIGFQCYQYIFRMHLDADDSRFIASAVDAEVRNYMFYCTSSTGEYASVFYQDNLKDAISPWMIYIASLSRIFKIHSAIIAHTILPSYFLLLAYSVYYLIGMRLTKNNHVKSMLYLVICSLLILFYGGSSHTQGSVILVRIWQGKALLAAFILPLILMVFIRIYQEKDLSKQIWILFFIDAAACLLSGMGIFFAGFMICCFGFMDLLMNRKWIRIPIYLCNCIPSIVFCIVNYLVR
jgi:hypothetical protein